MTIVYSVLFMSLLGVGAGIFLAFASAKFAVKKDPRIALIEASLPGANCGACGFPGCAAFAKAVAEGKAPIEGCIPGKRSGVPEKLKLILDTDIDKLIALFDENEEDAEKTLEKLLASSGKAVKAAPPKIQRPTQEEIDSYKEKLKENPRAAVIFAVLPNINCALCGSPGCAAFAIKVANKDEDIAKCVPGKPQNVSQKVAKIMALSEAELQKIIEETSGEPAEIKKKFAS